MRNQASRESGSRDRASRKPAPRCATPHRRIARSVVAVALVSTVTACGDQPLEGVGARTGEWIGPILHNVQLLPDVVGPAILPDRPSVGLTPSRQ